MNYANLESEFLGSIYYFTIFLHKNTSTWYRFRIQIRDHCEWAQDLLTSAILELLELGRTRTVGKQIDAVNSAMSN